MIPSFFFILNESDYIKHSWHAAQTFQVKTYEMEFNGQHWKAE